MMEVRSFKNVWRNPYSHARGNLHEADQCKEAEGCWNEYANS